MGAATTCQICSGPLRLRYPGAGIEADAAVFSPTNHAPGQYGDLYACEACGTVHQPSLPHGDALLDLYRAMHDERYLDEERGRRRTARRLMRALAVHAPRGRLLDVGCGHGLLLDEARRSGWAVEGLEPSRRAAAYARERLKLPVREQTLADLAADADPPCYDAIVLADVLEHLDDPVAAIEDCRKLLAPGGVLCLVTPDPASATARLAGPRWWGYLPAHTYLLPRETLRNLLEERGLAVVHDRSLVRTFTLRYWMAGFAERGGALGAGVSVLRGAVPARASLSLSLGDETVMLARNGVPAGTRAERTAARPAAAPA